VVSVAAFKASLSEAAPAPDITPPLAALWWAAKGDWNKAHNIVQDEDTADAAWVHAYLHRKEGDRGNAAYWYQRAKKPLCPEPLEMEWRSIVNALLE